MINQLPPRRRRALELGLLFLAFNGCFSRSAPGPKLYRVSGTVTLNGQSLDQAEIQFESVDDPGIRTYAGKVLNGKYDLRMEPGQKRVRISSLQEVPGKFVEFNPGERVPLRKEAIPPGYNEKTTLEASVEPQGKNQIDFELQGESAK